jgi:hypothetical protein
MAATGIAGFMFTNWLICKLLNGSKETYTSDEKYAKARPEHAHEQWVFLNGVAVGYDKSQTKTWYSPLTRL